MFVIVIINRIRKLDISTQRTKATCRAREPACSHWLNVLNNFPVGELSILRPK